MIRGVSSDSDVQLPLYVVRPPRAWRLPDIGEVWRYRALLRVLCWRELQLRYRQTALGFTWVILQPLVSSLILAVIFSAMGIARTSVPYVAVVFTGIIVWQFFSSSVQRAGNSVVLEGNLITKVYFPRLIVPLSTVGAASVDFCVSTVVLFFVLLLYRIRPDWHIVFFPLFILLTAIAAIGVSLSISALNVKYRDFMHAAPFLLQVWMFASPVVYEANAVPERWRVFFELNPAVGFIEGARWSLLHTPFPGRAVGLSIVVSVALCATGAIVFRRIERELTDVI